MSTTNSTTQVKRPDLAALVTDVLADLAFMVRDIDSAGPPVRGLWLECEIEYHGPFSGRVTSWCTRPFATQLCANLLGIDADDRSATVEAEDALREFMNVLCGQLVTAWYGRTAVFNLSIPIVRECMERPQREAAQGQAAQLCVNGEPLVCVHAAGDRL